MENNEGTSRHITEDPMKQKGNGEQDAKSSCLQWLGTWKIWSDIQDAKSSCLQWLGTWKILSNIH